MTSYDKVFQAFLSKISDPIYLEMEHALAQEDMISLMDAAIFNFPYSKVNLKAKDDESMKFDNELGLDEIQLLSHLMVLEWQSRVLRDIDSLKQRMTTREFRTFSAANHINSLIASEKLQRKKVKDMKIKYSMYDNNGSRIGVLGGKNS